MSHKSLAHGCSVYAYVYVCMYTQVHLKKLEYREKLFFLELISISETFIYSRFITCKVKYFKSFSCFFPTLFFSTFSNLKILEYFLGSINQKKKGFAKHKSSSYLKFVNLCTQYLVGAPLAQTPAAVRCGMEAISLWLCWGTIESSARLYCWIDCFSSFSWKYPIESIWGSGQACWLANQAP